MRIAVVGPTHPIKGGIAQHTTVMAQQLARAGHQVEIVSWLRQYPRRLYPGEPTVRTAEFHPFEPTRRGLSWNRPDSWIREALRLRNSDLVIFAHVTPIQAPAYRLMLRVLSSGRARTIVVCHNVLPHERARYDEWLVRSLFGAADKVLVHTRAQAEIARHLTARPVLVAAIAPHAPEAFTPRQPERGVHHRLLFFGLVRPYKGLELLIEAMTKVDPAIRLRVAGEFWGGTERTERLLAERAVTGRVEILPGYRAAEEVPALFSDVDALVMPYLSATGSQGVATAFAFGVPVIVSTAGQLASDVHPDHDGLIFQAGDVADLASTITEFYRDDRPLRMRDNVRPVDAQPLWDRYLDTLLDARG